MLFPPDVLSGGFLSFPLAQRRYASPERGGACEAGGGVRKCRIRWGLSSACPNRQCRPSIRRESCGFEETSRFNLWRLVSCSVRRQQVCAGSACPTGSKWVQTQPVRIGSADRQSARNPANSKKPAASIYGGWFRVLSGGSKCVQAQPVRIGSADRQSARNPADSKKPAASIYGGWFRVLSGGSKWNRALPGRLSNVSYSFFLTPDLQPARFESTKVLYTDSMEK